MDKQRSDDRKTPPEKTQASELNPDFLTSRRRLLKHATLAAPAVLTLRSGSALAGSSSCDTQGSLNPTSDVVIGDDALYRCEDSYSVSSTVTSCSAVENVTTGETVESCADETVTTYYCRAGALYSSAAWASFVHHNCV